jgi:Flp pilus assembly protein TadG
MRANAGALKEGKLATAIRGAGKAREGVAATEFALVLPVLMLLFFGMLEASDALMANRKVSNSANALADLIGQEKAVTPGQMEDVFLGVTNMLEPRGVSNVTMRVVSVSRDPNDATSVRVDWSRDNSGGTPYAPGSPYTKLKDQTVLLSGVSLIVAEMTYAHESGLTKYVLGAPIVMSQTAARWPRRSNRVQLCQPNPNDPDNPICPN